MAGPALGGGMLALGVTEQVGLWPQKQRGERAQAHVARDSASSTSGPQCPPDRKRLQCQWSEPRCFLPHCLLCVGAFIL